MIIGHLDALPLAGLPPVLYALLSRPDCPLQALANAMTAAGSRTMPPGFARLVRRRRSRARSGIRSTITSGRIFRLCWREKNSSMPARALLASRMTKSVKRTCSLPAHRHTASGSALARVTLWSFLPENHTRRCAPAARR